MSDNVVEVGRKLMRGALVELGKWLLIGCLTTAVLAALAHAAGYGWDDTDDRRASQHSEMRLRRDHLTGCEYLESRQGSLTPRLDRDGKQVCRSPA